MNQGHSEVSEPAPVPENVPEDVTEVDQVPVSEPAEDSTWRFRMSNLRNLRPVSEPAEEKSSFLETGVVSRNAPPD